MINPSALENSSKLSGEMPEPIRTGKFEILTAFLTSDSSSGLAADPVADPVTIRPSEWKNEAAEAVSPIETSEVTLWAQCFFCKIENFKSAMQDLMRSDTVFMINFMHSKNVNLII